MWLGTISKEQVEKLKEIFTFLTPQGWETPAWLLALEINVINRDKS